MDSRALSCRECEKIRLGFFHKYKDQGLISVSVVYDRLPWIKVEAEPDSDLPSEYEGFSVYIHYTKNRWILASL